MIHIPYYCIFSDLSTALSTVNTYKLCNLNQIYCNLVCNIIELVIFRYSSTKYSFPSNITNLMFSSEIAGYILSGLTLAMSAILHLILILPNSRHEERWPPAPVLTTDSSKLVTTSTTNNDYKYWDWVMHILVLAI